MKINLTKIVIENFKSIKKIEIPLLVNSQGLDNDIVLNGFKYIADKRYGLPPYTVIFGRNAIGKSSILSAISFVSDLYNGALNDITLTKAVDDEMLKSNVNNSNLFDNNFSKLIPEMANKKTEIYQKFSYAIKNQSGEFYSKFNSSLYEILRMFHTNHSFDHNSPIIFSLEFFNENKFIDVLISIDKDGNLKVTINTENSEEQNAISNYLALIRISSSSLPVNEKLNVYRNNRGNIDDIDYLNTIFVHLKNILGEKKLVNVIRLADSAIENINFRTLNNADSNLKMETCESINVKNGKVSLLELSSGTRHFASMLFNILSNSEKGNSLVLIDEIELSLHKELIDSLKILMTTLFEKKNIQFIFTTHSPLAVYEYTSFKQIISITKNENGDHLCERLSAKFKQHQSIINRYVDGDLSPYPDSENARNIMGGLID